MSAYGEHAKWRAIVGHRIKILRNFVEPADADKVIRLIQAGPTIPFIDNPDPRVQVLPNTNTAAEWMLKKYSDKLIKEHKEEFGWTPNLFTTQAHASVWHAGSMAHPHIDSHDGSQDIIFSSVVYLGGDFTGGRIVFTNHDFAYEPEPLSAVIFPSGGWEYQHMVEQILTGTRYTMAMWHTGYYPRSLQQKYLQENNILLSNLWSANYEAGVCGI